MLWSSDIADSVPAAFAFFDLALVLAALICATSFSVRASTASVRAVRSPPAGSMSPTIASIFSSSRSMARCTRAIGSLATLVAAGFFFAGAFFDAGFRVAFAARGAAPFARRVATLVLFAGMVLQCRAPSLHSRFWAKATR